MYCRMLRQTKLAGEATLSSSSACRDAVLSDSQSWLLLQHDNINVFWLICRISWQRIAGTGLLSASQRIAGELHATQASYQTAVLIRRAAELARNGLQLEL